jgi:cell division septum initiation protein DivIVA
MDESADNLSPASIAGKTFSSKLRGVDATEVQAFLELTAARVKTLEADRDAWHSEVDRLREEVLSLQESLAQQTAEPDEAALTEQLGQEAGRVLTEARAAATDRIAEAEAEAVDIIGAAEELYAERSRVADIEAERILSAARTEERTRLEAADDEAGTIRDKAREDAVAIASEAGVSQQAADAEGARIIREAELTRRQILEDLARKRSSARRQIEQLRAGRERLLASHEVVRRALEEISDELNISMSEARAAAETAGHNVSDSTLEEIEAEIETAKLAGLLDTGPLPVVTPAGARTRTVSSVSSVDDAGVAAESTETETPETVEARTDVAAPETGDQTSGPEAESADHAAETEDVDSSTAAPEPTSEPAEPDAPSPKPDIEPKAKTDTSDADGADNDGPLAKVVSLKAVREDVDTDRHPANRRPQREQPAATEPPAPVERLEVVEAPASADDADVEQDGEAVEVAAADVVADETADADADLTEPVVEPEPEAVLEEEPVDEAEDLPEPVTAEVATEPEPEVEPVVTAEPEPEIEPVAAADEPEERVDSLFARMRQTQDAAVRSGESEPASATAPSDTPDAVPDASILSDGIGRKLKRVLADEQSDVLSTLRAADQAPPVEDLLGTVEVHRLRYWSVTQAFLQESVSELAPSADPQAEVDRMVDNLRRKIVECVDQDANDTDVLVDRLRSVYREVKTQRIAEHAQIICAAAIELNAS